MRTKRHFFRKLFMAAVPALLLLLLLPASAPAKAGSALEAAWVALGSIAKAMAFSGSGYGREIDGRSPAATEDTRAAVATEIRDRSLFIADVEPELCAAKFLCSPLLPPWERASFRAANLLWRLAPSTEALRRAKEALLDTSVPAAERLDDLEETVDDLYAAAGIFWEALEGVSNPLSRGRFPFTTYTLNGRIKTQQALAPYLSFAGRHLPGLTAVVHEYSLDAHTVFRAVWRFRDAPEKAAAVLALLSDKNVSSERRNMLAARIPDLPGNAENNLDELFDALMASIRTEDLYTIMTIQDFDLESVALPLASILPRTAEDIAGKGSVPLNAGGEAPAPGALTSRTLEKLASKDLLEKMLDAGFSGKAPALPFLREGETLYAVVDPDESGATPVFSPDGPLGPLSGAGPVILPYNARTAELFGILLMTERDVPFFAAHGAPGDLAEHLAGLSVMLTERERALYGAFEEYRSAPDAEFLKRMSSAGITPEDFPADLPGRHVRFVDILDTLFIPTLAEQADAAGLARLMGPIRAMWVPSWHRTPGTEGVYALWDTVWTEHRYTPASPPAVSALGEAPVLELDTPALEALRQKHAAAIRAQTAQSLASQECIDRQTGENNPECGELYDVMQSATSATYWALERLGFRSPIELHSTSYALLYLRDNAKADAAILGVLRDPRWTPAAKAEEIMDIFNAAQKDAAPAIPTVPPPLPVPAAPAEAAKTPADLPADSPPENTADEDEGAVPDTKADTTEGGVSSMRGAEGSEDASSSGEAHPGGARRENAQPASRYGSWDDGIGPNAR